MRYVLRLSHNAIIALVPEVRIGRHAYLHILYVDLRVYILIGSMHALLIAFKNMTEGFACFIFNSHYVNRKEHARYIVMNINGINISGSDVYFRLFSSAKLS